MVDLFWHFAFCACCACRGTLKDWAGFPLTRAAKTHTHTPAADWQSVPSEKPCSSCYLLPHAAFRHSSRCLLCPSLRDLAFHLQWSALISIYQRLCVQWPCPSAPLQPSARPRALRSHTHFTLSTSATVSYLFFSSPLWPESLINLTFRAPVNLQ